MPSTITLQSRLNFASTHAELLPLTGVGGITNEPGISICNEAISEIINDKNDWKWNSVELCSPQQLTLGTGQPLIVSRAKQDYQFAGACSFTMNIVPSSGAATGTDSSGAPIDLASNGAVTVTAGTVTVTTLEPHRFLVGNIVRLVGLVAQSGNPANAANYNNTFTDDGNKSTWNTGYAITAVTSTTFSFAAIAGQNNGDILGAPGIFNMGWLTASSMQELNNNSSPPNLRHLIAQRNLPMWSKAADPEYVTIVNDNGAGVLTVRILYVPAGIIWMINLKYQKAAPLLSSLGATFDPIPDRYFSMINQAILYRMYRYLNSPTAADEYKKLEAEIFRARGVDQAEQSGIYLEPDQALIDYGPYWIGGAGGY